MIIEVGEVDALIPIVFEHILQQLLALIGDPNPVGFVVNFFSLHNRAILLHISNLEGRFAEEEVVEDAACREDVCG